MTPIEAIWSEQANIEWERTLWLTVLRFHMDHDVIPFNQSALDAYASNIGKIDLNSIYARERITRHDVKARIEEYNSLAGFELIHLGMTSADVVDNGALYRMMVTNEAVRSKLPGFHLPRVPFRGIKGAVGTQQDQLDLLGSEALCHELDLRVANRFGWDPSDVMNAVGQVYPRSIDFQWASALAQLPLIPSDRIFMSGYLTMLAAISGDQWNEGDVSTSVVRRVALPGVAYVTFHTLEYLSSLQKQQAEKGEHGI